jgi:hypothetical protein
MAVDWEARAGVVAEFRASGMTHAEFAAARGMKVSALRAWIYRAPTASGLGRGGRALAGRAPRFVDVSPGTSAATVELQLGGLVVRTTGYPPPEWVAALLARTRA